jgi:hypothetical protein
MDDNPMISMINHPSIHQKWVVNTCKYDPKMVALLGFPHDLLCILKKVKMVPGSSGDSWEDYPFPQR